MGAPPDNRTIRANIDPAAAQYYVLDLISNRTDRNAGERVLVEVGRLNVQECHAEPSVR